MDSPAEYVTPCQTQHSHYLPGQIPLCDHPELSSLHAQTYSDEDDRNAERQSGGTSLWLLSDHDHLAFCT
jgi:hypothetical protein